MHYLSSSAEAFLNKVQATATVEFEDGLRTEVLLGGCWCPCGSCTYPRINFKPPWGASWSCVGCGCHNDPISDQIPTCLVPGNSGIKLQLLCVVRIELALEVGSLFVSQNWPEL